MSIHIYSVEPLTAEQTAKVMHTFETECRKLAVDEIDWCINFMDSDIWIEEEPSGTYMYLQHGRSTRINQIRVYLWETPKTDRLTEYEQQFATDHHDEIYKFLRIKGLDIEEWYTVVVPGFLKAVRDYCRNTVKASKYPFYVFANRSMTDCVLKEYRAMSRDKRAINYMALSLDAELHDNNGNGDTVQLGDLVADTKNDFEDYIFTETLKAAISRLTEIQRNIVSLMTDGFSKADIIKLLNLKRAVFNGELESIRQVFAESL